MTVSLARGTASFRGLRADGVAEIRHDLQSLDEPGVWVVVLTFEGHLTAVRMAEIERSLHVDDVPSAPVTTPPDADLTRWRTSLGRTEYRDGVEQIRALIRRGEVYQVNLCRVMEREIAEGANLDRLALTLAEHNPARYAARIDIPEAGLDVVCASPELYLARGGDRLTSSPIKGTAPAGGRMLPKDHTENVMITDLVRNDLSSVSVPGTVAVDGLCVPEAYPGSTHLVSTVSSRLRPGARWSEILAAAFPPGSVSGAPKSSALKAIRRLEPVPRGPYCGAIGYVDNETRTARLAVGIRTFWAARDDGDRRVLRFGTGAGITWGSDPEGEWCETVLKARRLVALAELAIGGQEK
ncbi:chorismate-binding protein [Leekyejoonella antrihumi]|uniref:Anthranilate synthase component I family protein n=1 Tax=Leekyejoonella antrihumi TaxID=1660198 RepID=A0A563E1M6_9MICO|nr:chorismate-binding protein [Leekyejoonella antrihumi]TWP35804.1 anthranilate synthase component I family protein [Leekyejoonella antrihumi]